MVEGRGRRARAVTEEVEDLAARMRTPSAKGAALVCRGLADDDSEALVEAAALLGKGPRPLPRAHACEEAGSTLARQARRDKALQLFQEALGTYERLGALQGVARIRARLRALGVRHGRRGARPDRPHSGWASLTVTEHQVADLAADGLTYREIGERLFVSPRTAETHLRHIYSKLEITSRRELQDLASGRPAAPR